MFPYAGEIGALTSALFWASASAVYGVYVRRIHPLVLNFAKGMLAALMLAATAWLLGMPLYSWNDAYRPVLLLISGMLGLGIGDTIYFAALKHVSARISLLIQMLTPPLTALIAWIFIGEALSWQAWLGIFITIAGISWVVNERAPQQQQQGSKARGVVYNIIASVAAAVGTVLARVAMSDMSSDPMQATFLRLIGGNVFLVAGFVWLWRRNKSAAFPAIPAKTGWIITAAVFFGTFLSIWLQQIALQRVEAGLAQTLFSTSPLFVIPISAMMGEKVTWRAVAGALVAIGGIALLF